VQEAELSTEQRVGGSESSVLVSQTNLANTYQSLGRSEEAMRMRRHVYSGRLKLSGEEHRNTLIAANNYALSLLGLKRFEEARSVWRKIMPVVRRVLGKCHDHTLMMRWNYAVALCADSAATLADLRESVTTLEETERTARRVLGGAHPLTGNICGSLRTARTVLHARETPSSYHEGKSFEELRLEYLIRTN